MEEMAKKFEKNSALVSCLSRTVTRGVWFVNNGASRHITGSWDFFTTVTRGPRDVNVALGDKANYLVKGNGSIEFQMDSGGIMEVNEVLYVPSLEKNLLSISAMEDCVEKCCNNLFIKVILNKF